MSKRIGLDNDDLMDLDFSDFEEDDDILELDEDLDEEIDLPNGPGIDEDEDYEESDIDTINIDDIDGDEEEILIDEDDEEEVKEIITKTTKEKKVKAPVKEKVVEERTYETYEELINSLVEKAKDYEVKKKMGVDKSGRKIIPPSKNIGREAFANIVAAKMRESESFNKRMISIINKITGISSSAIAEGLEGYAFNPNDAKSFVNLVLDTLYDVLASECGFYLFNSKDKCNAIIAGEMTKAKLVSTTHLLNAQSDNQKGETATYIKPFLKISVKSPAPKDVKVKGVVVNGKFKPNK